MKKKIQVFVSHTQSDATLAHRIAADLAAAGLASWIAPDSILPGEGRLRLIPLEVERREVHYMPKTKTNWDAVRKIGLALPEVEEGTAHGSPALKVGGRMFACIAIHKSAEPDTLAVRMEFDRRDALIAEDPRTYYLADHYVNYPCVLVRLTRVREDALRDLLLMGWRFMSTTKKLEVRKRAKTRRGGAHGVVLPSHRAHGRR